MNLQAITPRPLFSGIGRIHETVAPLSDPLVRIATGLFLVPHGAQKLFGWFGGYGPAATGQFFAEQLALEPGLAFAVLAGLIEVVGGVLLALGAFTRPVALAVTGLLLVAALHVHLPNGFFWTNGGAEYPLLWAIVAASFVLRGGGRYSFDGLLGRRF